jgi:hypothetical protein
VAAKYVIMKAQFVYEALGFERGQDPKSALGLGLIAKFDKFAKGAGMRRVEPDEEDLDIFANDEILAKWQQFANGNFYAGFLILFRDGADGELYTYIISDYDEDTYPLEQWMAQPIWIYHFSGD